MNKQVSLSRYILVILCVSVVFTALILVILNSWAQNNRLSSGIPGLSQLAGGSYDQGYKDGYNAAREKFRAQPPVTAGVVTDSITGPIQSIGDKQIVVMAMNLDTDQTVDGISNERTIMLDDKTTIVERTMLSSDTQAKQIQNWTKANDNSPPPLPYTDKAIKLSDLKVGDNVTVMSADDIRLKPSFTATQIVVTRQAATSTNQ